MAESSLKHLCCNTGWLAACAPACIAVAHLQAQTLLGGALSRWDEEPKNPLACLREQQDFVEWSAYYLV